MGAEAFAVFPQSNLMFGKVEELEEAVAVISTVPDDKASSDPFVDEGFELVGGDILPAGKEGGAEKVRLAGDASFAIGKGEEPGEGEPAGIGGEGVDFSVDGDGV